MIRDFAFFFCIALTLTGGVLAVNTNRAFRSALALALCLSGTAGLFVFLHADFLAALQLFLYAGAVTTAIALALLMSGPDQPPSRPVHCGAAAAVCLGLFAVLVILLGNTPWPLSQNPERVSGVELIGTRLLTGAVLPFELCSLILLAAIMGSLLIVGRRKKS